jgi:glycosyltransferase involved in cell wall biosynthesis
MAGISKSYQKNAFYWLARLRLAWLTARLLHWATKPVPLDGAGSRSGSPRYRILCLGIGKAGFQPDLEEIFGVSGDFELVTWPPLALRSMADAILARRVDNNTYLNDDKETVAARSEYEEFIASVWRHITSFSRIDAILSPNFFYHRQRPLAAAAERSATPFIVLHKENLKSPARVEYWRHLYRKRGQFPGRKILVYNEIERELLGSAGVTDISNVVVTGMPRLDKVHRWRSHDTGSLAQKKPQVLFFSFDKKDKLPKDQQLKAYADKTAQEKWSGLTWAEVSAKTHKAMIDLAVRRPDISVVIKTKAIEQHRAECSALLNGSAVEIPPNLKVVNGGDPFTLLTESSVVVGFNTTAQLEALAAGKPLIVPSYGEAVAPGTRDFVIDLGDAVHYAHSPEELVEIASRLADRDDERRRQLRPGELLALDRWTGNKDGKAGLRVRELLMREIEGSAADAAPSKADATAVVQQHA